MSPVQTTHTVTDIAPDLLQPTACLSSVGHATGHGCTPVAHVTGCMHTNKLGMLRSRGLPPDVILDLIGMSATPCNLASPAATAMADSPITRAADATIRWTAASVASQHKPIAAHSQAAHTQLEERAVRATQRMRLPGQMRTRLAAGQLGTAYQPAAVQATHYLMRHTDTLSRCVLASAHASCHNLADGLCRRAHSKCTALWCHPCLLPQHFRIC